MKSKYDSIFLHGEKMRMRSPGFNNYNRERNQTNEKRNDEVIRVFNDLRGTHPDFTPGRLARLTSARFGGRAGTSPKNIGKIVKEKTTKPP
jgi:hypothetical protein